MLYQAIIYNQYADLYVVCSDIDKLVCLIDNKGFTEVQLDCIVR